MFVLTAVQVIYKDSIPNVMESGCIVKVNMEDTAILTCPSQDQEVVVFTDHQILDFANQPKPDSSPQSLLSPFF